MQGVSSVSAQHLLQRKKSTESQDGTNGQQSAAASVFSTYVYGPQDKKDSDVVKPVAGSLAASSPLAASHSTVTNSSLTVLQDLANATVSGATASAGTVGLTKG